MEGSGCDHGCWNRGQNEGSRECWSSTTLTGPFVCGCECWPVADPDFYVGGSALTQKQDFEVVSQLLDDLERLEIRNLSSIRNSGVSGALEKVCDLAYVPWKGLQIKKKCINLQYILEEILYPSQSSEGDSTVFKDTD